MSERHVPGSSECRELAARLSEFVDGELPQEVAEEVRTHFDGCVKCEEFVASIERVRDLAAILRRPLLSEEQLARICAEVKKQTDS